MPICSNSILNRWHYGIHSDLIWFNWLMPIPAVAICNKFQLFSKVKKLPLGVQMNLVLILILKKTWYWDAFDLLLGNVFQHPPSLHRMWAHLCQRENCNRNGNNNKFLSTLPLNILFGKFQSILKLIILWIHCDFLDCFPHINQVNCCIDAIFKIHIYRIRPVFVARVLWHSFRK